MSAPDVISFWALLAILGSVFFIAGFLCVWLFVIGADDETDDHE